MKFIRKFSALFRRKRLDAEMSEEMRLHLERRVEENAADGLSPQEARYAALRKFGGVEQVKEVARDQRGFMLFHHLVQDLRYGLRQLRKSPGFSVTVVLTLALGIGVNAALFTVYDLIALKPLPSREADALLSIRARNEGAGGSGDPRFSYPDYLDYREGNRAFTHIAAMTALNVKLSDEIAIGSDSLLGTGAGAGAVTVQAITENYFSTLGARVALGRDFLPEEAGDFAGKPVMIVSHLFWQRHLQAVPEVLGKTVAMQTLPAGERTFYTIIGVAAPDFVGQLPVPPAGWIPLSANPRGLNERAERSVLPVGRLRAEISLPQAQADLDAIARRLAENYPAPSRPAGVRLLPGMRPFNPQVTPETIALFSPVVLAFGLVLVVACLNVANLLLARGITRQYEIGVRLSLGASRGRVVRQLLTENFLLCMLGAGAGLVAALWTLSVLRPSVAALLQGANEARNIVSRLEIWPDVRIILFTGALTVLAGFGAGLLPALHACRRNVFSALKRTGSVFGGPMSQSRLRDSLIVAQVAVCLALLSVSGVMVGNLVKIRGGKLGFEPERVFAVGVSPRGEGAAPQALSSVKLRELVETLRTVPGIVSATLVENTPLSKPDHNHASMAVKIPGSSAEPERVDANRVSAGFFETFGVPLRRGRGFTVGEVAAGSPVVVVSEMAAKRLWPGQEAVGKFISIDVAMATPQGAPPSAVAARTEFRDFEIVGIAGEIRSNWTSEVERPLVFLPWGMQPFAGTFYVRVQADSASALSNLERGASASGITLKFQDQLTVIIAQGVRWLRLFAWMSGTLAGLALVLAAVGLYGVMAFAVNQRVREIGIRIALGATAQKVIALFLRHGLRLATLGIAGGLFGGVALTVLVTKGLPPGAVIANLPFRLAVFGVVSAFMVTVAGLACWLPARRAAKVDPMVALRAE